MSTAPNTSQDIDNVIKAEMAFHLPTATPPPNVCNCTRCDDIWPCQYIIQASITLKLTAIAAILQSDQLAIIQGVIGNGNTSRQGKGR